MVIPLEGEVIRRMLCPLAPSLLRLRYSTWVMMNLKTRRLAKITEDIREEGIVHSPNPPGTPEHQHTWKLPGAFWEPPGTEWPAPSFFSLDTCLPHSLPSL